MSMSREISLVGHYINNLFPSLGGETKELLKNYRAGLKQMNTHHGFLVDQ
jgi:hypothetical protein